MKLTGFYKYLILSLVIVPVSGDRIDGTFVFRLFSLQSLTLNCTLTTA